jgi:hypothetical protein
MVEKRDHITEVRPDGVRRAIVHTRQVQAELVRRLAQGGRQSLVDLARAHVPPILTQIGPPRLP